MMVMSTGKKQDEREKEGRKKRVYVRKCNGETNKIVNDHMKEIGRVIRRELRRRTIEITGGGKKRGRGSCEEKKCLGRGNKSTTTKNANNRYKNNKIMAAK